MGFESTNEFLAVTILDNLFFNLEKFCGLGGWAGVRDLENIFGQLILGFGAKLVKLYWERD
jgi:hypothetical protein